MAVTVLLAACAYHGDIDDPFVRKFAWFSYLDAEDIRIGCVKGTVDRYRFVYNARYEEQLRAYEITGDGAGGGHFVARAIAGTMLIDVSPGDVLAPWRWRKSEKPLTPTEFQSFQGILRADGISDGGAAGLRLFSGDFYWVGAACEAGVFHYNAWLYPGNRYDTLRFPKFFSTHDETGLPVNAPRFVPTAERIGAAGRRDDQTGIRFWLQVREQGLGGL
ncbi:MAG: hypothetical protein ACREEE_08325 [Dongiaceae bacterium]